jgi:hypothetical protein
MVERFVPPRKQIHTDTRLDRDSAITVEFYFEDPSRPVDELWDGGAVHWFDEVGLAPWKSLQSSYAASLHPKREVTG